MEYRDVSRRSLLTTGGLSVAALFSTGARTPGSAPPPGAHSAGAGSAGPAVARPAGASRSAGASGSAASTPGGGGPDHALDRLLTGNRRFVRGRARQPRQGPAAVRRSAHGQRPFAVVVGCADSRVPPEVIFDQGLGDLFDNRVAGHIVDDLVLSSVEYAVAEFACPLIVVLGHERCGAVTAAVAAARDGHSGPGHAAVIIDALRPVVATVLERQGDVIEHAVRANVRTQVRRLAAGSALIAQRIAQGDLTVVGARYDLDHGRVTVLDGRTSYI